MQWWHGFFLCRKFIEKWSKYLNLIRLMWKSCAMTVLWKILKTLLQKTKTYQVWAFSIIIFFPLQNVCFLEYQLINTLVSYFKFRTSHRRTRFEVHWFTKDLLWAFLLQTVRSSFSIIFLHSYNFRDATVHMAHLKLVTFKELHAQNKTLCV